MGPDRRLPPRGLSRISTQATAFKRKLWARLRRANEAKKGSRDGGAPVVGSLVVSSPKRGGLLGVSGGES
jgi:hypothetical protein